jgi:hypothetical protein
MEFEVRIGTSSGLSDMWLSGIQTVSETGIVYEGLALIDGTDYWFGIRVYDGYEWSSWNETMYHMNTPPPAPLPPVDPQNGSEILHNSSQILSWSSGGVDSEGDEILYHWYLDTEFPLTPPFIASNSTTSLTSQVFSTSTGLQYYWYVNTTDGWEWNISQIWSFSVVEPPNSIPYAVNLTVQDYSEGTTEILHITDHTPELAWNFMDSDIGDSQMWYQVRVGSSSGSSDLLSPDPVAGTVSMITHSGMELSDGEDYWFGVRVSDGKEWSDWTEVMFHTNLAPEIIDITVDGYPEGSWEILNIMGLQPVFDSNQTDSDGGLAQKMYEIRVGITQGGSELWASGPQTGLLQNITYQGSNLSRGTEYWVGIRISDGIEWGEWRSVLFKTNTNPQLQWTEDSGYESDGVEPDQGDATTIYVFMIKYVDAENHPPISGYPRLHILKDGLDIAESPFTLTYESGTNQTGAVFSVAVELSQGSNYSYYFTAMDIVGEEETSTSIIGGPMVEGTPYVPPEVPINVTAAPTSNQGELSISWDEITVVDIEGYRIYRSETPLGSGNASEYELVGTVDTQTTTLVDSNLEDDTTYYYIVRSYDSQGNESDFYQEISATTIKYSEEGDDSNPVVLILLLVVILIIILLMIFMMIKKRDKNEEQPPSMENNNSSLEEKQVTDELAEDLVSQNSEKPKTTIQKENDIEPIKDGAEPLDDPDFNEEDLPPPDD